MYKHRTILIPACSCCWGRNQPKNNHRICWRMLERRATSSWWIDCQHCCNLWMNSGDGNASKEKIKQITLVKPGKARCKHYKKCHLILSFRTGKLLYWWYGPTIGWLYSHFICISAPMTQAPTSGWCQLFLPSANSVTPYGVRNASWNLAIHRKVQWRRKTTRSTCN